MITINEALYFYLKHSRKYLPSDWRDDMLDFWYTLGCYWLDHNGGGSNMLWYIRKTFNYVTLNDFLTDVEITNRLLQLVIVIRNTNACGEPHLPRSPSNWSDIIRTTKCLDAHVCNYNWMCTIFLEADDKKRVHKTMSLAMLPEHTGTIVTPSARNHPRVIKELLVQKLKLST